MPSMIHPDCHCCQLANKEFDDYIENFKYLSKKEYMQKIEEFFKNRDILWGGHCEDCWNKYHNGLRDKDYDDSFNPFKRLNGQTSDHSTVKP
jgi:hypothetical protein